MSNKENNRDLIAIEEKKFWSVRRNVNIFNLFVVGKDIPFIAEQLTMKPVTVESVITRKYFIKKLESHIKGLVFTNQVAKVIASSDVFSKLWERVMDNINDIPPEICLKELTKLFPTKKEGMIINPKNMNIFVNALKEGRSPENIEDTLTDDNLGFEGLDENSDAIYPELGEGEQKDGDKQGDPSVDPKESNKNQ